MAVAVGMAQPAHLLAEKVRQAVLQTTPRYPFMHSSHSVRSWHEVCDERSCEQYSVGDGYCLFQAVNHAAIASNNLLEKHELERMNGMLPLVLLGSNCKAGDLGMHYERKGANIRPARPDLVGELTLEVQLLHCPKEVPVAIFPMPKCGKTSTVNWAIAMEGDKEDRSLAFATRLLLRHGEWRLNELVTDWLYPELYRSAVEGDAHFEHNLSDGDAYTFIARTLSRYRFERGAGKFFYRGAVQQFVPPAHLCATCCMYAHGRQVVVVGRNPFVRLTSYFRYKWLHSSSRWRRWTQFKQWLFNLLDARDALGTHGFAFHSGWRLPSEVLCSGPRSLSGAKVCDVDWIDASEIFHVRPLGDMARDERFFPGAAAFATGAFVLHLETLLADMAQLVALLCKRFSYCRGLPVFPDRVLPGQNVLEGRSALERCALEERSLQWFNCSAPPWVEMWPQSLVDRVVTAYADDFKWLGYATSPTSLLPIANV